MPQNKILISACLLGENVKYDGKNNSIKDNPDFKKLFNSCILIGVCPEVEGGLPTPRTPCEIQNGRVINRFGEDKTCEFEKGAKTALQIAKKEGIKVAILKSKSPSCGSGEIYDGTFSHRVIQGDGISAKLLKQNGIRVFSENELKEAYNYLREIENGQ